ncbi:hypothetical protein GUJ93_ZPchr0008g13476 [Zizania palustris]|uniref:Pentatricopeptide repeat-containing protein n=1 Tax=Zizania palustris TaxID=103762 RepID=A0A8J5R0L2_ZIZPA|nr:hypothetical protein GUJ93_ZPchr0008g13476 [Zizania palustris]
MDIKEEVMFKDFISSLKGLQEDFEEDEEEAPLHHDSSTRFAPSPSRRRRAGLRPPSAASAPPPGPPPSVCAAVRSSALRPRRLSGPPPSVRAAARASVGPRLRTAAPAFFHLPLSRFRTSGFDVGQQFTTSQNFLSAVTSLPIHLASDTFVLNALINMYSSCNYPAAARFKEAVELFRDMQIAGVKADDATIATVASSCGQMGALDLGRYVHAYCDSRGLGKEIAVKNSLIDIAYGQVELAEYAAERIEELEPKKCGGHVLLSNVYATTSRWVDVNKVRMGMDDSRKSKKPGCSFVEVDGCVHEFFAGDETHFETEAIYTTLFGINELLVVESFLT